MEAMKTIIVFLMGISCAAPLRAAEVPAVKPEVQVKEYAKYAAPAGWEASDKLKQGDPQVVLNKGRHIISIRLAGGKESLYKTPGDFLVGFEGRSNGGKAAEKTAYVKVSGQKLMLYTKQAAVRLPPPGEGGPVSLAPEEFCLPGAGKRFFVLSYRYDDEIPDPDYDGKAAWRSFLGSFRVIKKK